MNVRHLLSPRSRCASATLVSHRANATLVSHRSRCASATLVALVVVASVVLQASSASAQRVVYVQPIVRQPYTHTGGFFGRAQLGFAYSHTSYPAADLEWGGGAIDFSASLGFSLPAGVALHVDFLANGTFEPTLYENGVEVGYLADTSYTTSGIGGGVTYYFLRNGFITGGLGFAVSSTVDPNYRTDSDVGGYLTFGGGKEWWVAPRFGVGFYGRLTGYSLPDTYYDTSWTTVVPAFGVSGTFD